VIDPAVGSGLGRARAGPLPLIPAICTLVALATFHESIGWPPGATCDGVKRNVWIAGGPATEMRFFPAGRQGGHETIGVLILPKPAPTMVT